MNADRRIAAVQALAERPGTEGERAAAMAALERLAAKREPLEWWPGAPAPPLIYAAVMTEGDLRVRRGEAAA